MFFKIKSKYENRMSNVRDTSCIKKIRFIRMLSPFLKIPMQSRNKRWIHSLQSAEKIIIMSEKHYHKGDTISVK